MAKPVDVTLEEEPPLTSPTPLRPLTSLKWPYVPDESAFPDPLKKMTPSLYNFPNMKLLLHLLSFEKSFLHTRVFRNF